MEGDMKYFSVKLFAVSDSNSRIDQAEQESAAGLGQDSEEM